MEITYIKETKINIDNKVYSKMLDILLDPNCFDYEDLVSDGKLDAKEVVQCFYENIDYLLDMVFNTTSRELITEDKYVLSYTKMRDEFREFLKKSDHFQYLLKGDFY
jgi:hypothetical protein